MPNLQGCQHSRKQFFNDTFLLFPAFQAYELSTLTGTQVMLLVASETGHVYTFATRKLQPMITSDAGKALIQTCLNSPDPHPNAVAQGSNNDQRMSATGYEETELTYNIAESEEQQQKVRQMMYNSHYSAVAAATQHHTHNLFTPTSAVGGGGHHGPPGAPPMNSSSYGNHPAPSPSPSHPSAYGSVSISPSLSHSPPGMHHSPPFVPHSAQHR